MSHESTLPFDRSNLHLQEWCGSSIQKWQRNESKVEAIGACQVFVGMIGSVVILTSADGCH
ncbi:hypothetical protein LR48_Vigan09g052500 [Vigna angularis]|uniref:Uncharacterized protein n=1 Tax=Phaseolus angularis TaxID=3914 RepID=A0A0L9V9V8_PHAAN|nr:hypothetical protein LR48_Vigan09g052500 [Vigna angularis]